VGEVPMANVGTNFQWGKCQWPTSELTSVGGSANGQRRNQLPVEEVPMANVGTNFQRKKFFGHSRHSWHYLTLLSHCLTFWHHFGITQKNFIEKNFWAKKIKILIVVIFERYAQTDRQTNKLVVYINDSSYSTLHLHMN
jgi:hypothetical protein